VASSSGGQHAGEPADGCGESKDIGEANAAATSLAGGVDAASPAAACGAGAAAKADGR